MQPLSSSSECFFLLSYNFLIFSYWKFSSIWADKKIENRTKRRNAFCYWNCTHKFLSMCVLCFQHVYFNKFYAKEPRERKERKYFWCHLLTISVLSFSLAFCIFISFFYSNLRKNFLNKMNLFSFICCVYFASTSSSPHPPSQQEHLITPPFSSHFATLVLGLIHAYPIYIHF